MSKSADLTQLLVSARDGNRQAADQLLPHVYRELRILAAGLMRGERIDHTLQATALAHEAYLKLIDQTRVQWRDRAHFLAVAAQALRRILVDHARTRSCEKRGGGRAKLALTDDLLAWYDQQVDLIALDETLARFAVKQPEHAQIVELTFHGGL